MIEELSANIDVIIVGICAFLTLLVASVDMWLSDARQRRE